MAGAGVVNDEPAVPAHCWCCGRVAEPAKLVHLSNSPQVMVCTRCAHDLSRRARAIEDEARTGPAVAARNALRRVRSDVMRRGWHHGRVLGPLLRWIGRFTP
jgi:ribosome-binding protein aMBF1 (putative translation factor)